jgi:oligoendopeptidase F
MKSEEPDSALLITERDRAKIPDRYKWNMYDLYDSDASWQTAREALLPQIARVTTFRGTLSTSARTLCRCLDLLSDISKEYMRLYSYASMHADSDTRDTRYLAMRQEMDRIGSDFSAESSFIEPEILRMDADRIERFIAEEPGLSIHRHGLHDVLRRKAHTRSESEEKIIADAGLTAESSADVYTIFSNAEFPFPTVTLKDGSSVKLDKAAFALHRAAADPDDRRNVFSAYYGRLNEYRRTFGAQLYGEIKKNLFYQKSRLYDTCLHASLDAHNIPVDVYHSLIRNVNGNLSTFHRYLSLRKRILRLDELHMHDLYVPVVPALDIKYSFEEARDHILASIEPLGKEYRTVAERAFTERWMDVYPNDGKIGGAYSNGTPYDVHPYILLNYNGKYDDVGTVTHELGHTMHSYFSNTRQPHATARYSIFVAEVASTFNEALLLEHMLKTVADRKVRLTLLFNFLDEIRGTLFRQTQFAEFELALHTKAERGESLTGDSVSEIYHEIAKRYYIDNSGKCVVDDNMKIEWASVPHFFYNFYVFQYATSITASSALSEMVLAGDQAATERYLTLLSAGGSDYPIELLRRAGVDMTTPRPFEMMMEKMNRVMDEVEQLID